jgi:arginine-tRNA-protein transferase
MLFRGEEHSCPYLPGRTAQSVFTFPMDVDAQTYQRMMDAGFRRSGDFFYRPDCVGCRACLPIRVPVQRFAPTRSQRRAGRRNRDLTIETAEPRADDERWELFRRYQAYQHDTEMISTREEYYSFFCASPIKTLEMCYRLNGRLVGVGIVDVCSASLSSVYFFFEPDCAQRSLGVFSARCEIEETRRRGLPHWYLGYFVRGCAKMEYKVRYQPHEFLHVDGSWRDQEPANTFGI